MISATFSLVQQLTGMHAMPHFKVIHTDSSNKGQVLLPPYRRRFVTVLTCA